MLPFFMKTESIEGIYGTICPVSSFGLVHKEGMSVSSEGKRSDLEAYKNEDDTL